MSIAAPSPARRAALAIDALRHGWPIALEDGPVLVPAETAFVPDIHAGRMLISAARAATLKLVNQRAAAVPDAPVLIRAGETISLDEARRIADPSLDLATPLKGPFAAEELAWLEGAEAALELARIAGILPAFLIDAQGAGEPQGFAASDLAAWSDTSALTFAARARLPINAHESAEIIAFRSPHDLREHTALVIGERSGDTLPLVRVHSECLTGDVLGSLKCDCGPQLNSALHHMSEEARAHKGWGVLLYLRQEGRGIGIINKLRAYQLQDQGFDTVEANERLGLPDEARDFAVATRLLELLNIRKVRLMTNNPQKVESLKQGGIEIAERVPLSLEPNVHNLHYLHTKRDKSQHLLP